ncbi:hypothetical protein JCM10908_005383 [Rhodotorula pacifica]|uniref:uncharacterized protein n=1 Tax=Rhodotorula pacifica TaxID=1495444 RepID=UPI0031715D6E
MARRKSKWMDDGSSSEGDHSDNNLDDESYYDPNDPDVAAERELFRNPYGHQQRGKKRTRQELQDDATYGVFAASTDDASRGGAAPGVGASSSRAGKGNRKPDYLKGQAFVAAGQPKGTSSSAAPLDNLSSALGIEAPREDEEDVAMEMGSSSDGSDGEDEQDAGGGEELLAAEDIAAEQLARQGDDGDTAAADEEDLPPVPGLARPSPPPPDESAPEPDPEPEPEPTASLAFAPRGLGARAGIGRGGIGSSSSSSGRGGGGGIGSGSAQPRVGIGSGTAARAGLGATFAAASSLSTSGSSSGATRDRPPPSGTASMSGTASPLDGASIPHAGIGATSSGGRGGIGARPNQALVDAMRAELAGPPLESGDASSSSSAGASRTASPAPTPFTASGNNAAAPPWEKRSFLPPPPKPPGSTSTAPKPKLSKSESVHFARLASSGSVGMKMLEKMGWQTGSGLGREGQGIVTPIGEGQKLRNKNEGIRAGERSKGALLEEARRRGKSGAAGGDSDDDTGDDATRAAAAAAKKHQKHASAWQSAKPKKDKKEKTQFKTYEEIVAESGSALEDRQELLVDLNGQALPNQSLSSLPAFGAGSADPTRLPELRHNLTLLCSTLSSSLRALAKEGAGVEQRRAYLAKEETRVRQLVEAQERKITKMQGVLACVERVREKEVEAMELLRTLEMHSDNEVPIKAEDVLARFEDDFDQLLGEFANEYEELGLDEVVVGAIAPILRRLWQSWDPLSAPTHTVSQLKKFRKLFLIDKHNPSSRSAASTDLDIYAQQVRAEEDAEARRRQAERQMSPYETLMWTVWLPKIRSSINNAWMPSNPHPAVQLYTAWLPLLPAFVRDNILDQLILPKVSSAIADWSPSAAKRESAPQLHTLVFPWLEHAGERMEMVMDESKRKIRAWLKAWKARDGVPKGIAAWRDAFSKSDWDSLLLKHVLPQLGALLRTSLVINPRQQDMAPVEAVLAWQPLLRSSMLRQLLEAEFFPKWGEALWLWLTSDGVNFEQVSEWYSWWKSYFSDDVASLSGVSRGFRKGLDLMNQAMALGDDAQYRLQKPDFTPKHARAATPADGRTPTTARPSSIRTPAGPAPTADVTFRSVVEEMAAAANLVFLPTGKVAPQGQPLFRVSRTIEGKGGVNVYLEDDVVWLADKTGDFNPVSVEEMVKKAGG